MSDCSSSKRADKLRWMKSSAGFMVKFQRRPEHYENLEQYSACGHKVPAPSKQWESGSETLLFSLQIYGSTNCGLGHRGNLRICDLRINQYKFAICWLAHLRNVRICDCGINPRICGFATCGLTKKLSPPLFEAHPESNLESGSCQRVPNWTGSSQPALVRRLEILLMICCLKFQTYTL